MRAGAESLKGLEQRIAVIQTDDQAHIDAVLIEVIDKTATKRVGGMGRPIVC